MSAKNLYFNLSFHFIIILLQLSPILFPTSTFFFFFFNDTATTEIYTLSLHDALPISVVVIARAEREEGDDECEGAAKSALHGMILLVQSECECATWSKPATRDLLGT